MTDAVPDLPDWAAPNAVPSQALQDFCAAIAGSHQETSDAFAVANRLAIFGVATPSAVAFIDEGRLELMCGAYTQVAALSMSEVILFKRIVRHAVREDQIAEEVTLASRRATAAGTNVGLGAGSASQATLPQLSASLALPEGLVDQFRLQSEALQRMGKPRRGRNPHLGRDGDSEEDDAF